MYIRPYDDVSNAIRNSKTGQWADCELLIHIWNKLNVNDTYAMDAFLDIGANIGSCTLLMAAHNIPTVAFEPNPDNIYYLQQSVKSNPQFVDIITVVECGVGDVQSTLPIYVQPGNAGNSVIGKAVYTSETPSYEVIVDTLDNMLSHLTSIPLIKIDAQGYEMKIVQGALNLIQRGKVSAYKLPLIPTTAHVTCTLYMMSGVIKVIKLEVAPEFLLAQGTTQGQLYDYLEGLGYRILNEDFDNFPRHLFINEQLLKVYFDVIACLPDACALLQRGVDLNKHGHLTGVMDMYGKVTLSFSE
jgi:FkbM family methyltransferase